MGIVQTHLHFEEESLYWLIKDTGMGNTLLFQLGMVMGMYIFITSSSSYPQKYQSSFPLLYY